MLKNKNLLLYEHKYEAKCNAGMQSYDPYPFVILKCCDLIKFGSA